MHLFLIGFAIAVIGTLPPGLINIHAMERSLNKGVYFGFMLSLGAVIVEFFQIWISFEVAKSIGSLGHYAAPIQLFSGILFIGIAIFYFVKKSKNEKPKRIKINTDLSFFIGVFLSSINLLAIPYWIFYITFLKNSQLMLFRWSDFFILAIGGVLGALAVLMLYVYAGKMFKSNMLKWKRISDIIIGVLFLVLAAIQVYQYIL